MIIRHLKKFIRLSMVFFIGVALSLSITLNSHAFISGSESHAPPSSETYKFSPPGNFMPNLPGFPGAGGFYLDPVFNETVIRLTNSYPDGDRHVSYSAKLIINADSSMMLVQKASGTHLIYDLNGNLLRSGPNGFTPWNENWQWHPTDPQKILFMTSSELKEYSFANNNVTTLINFGSGLNNGGTGEFADQTARYYAGLAGEKLRFYDITLNSFYGNEPIIDKYDYVIMAPDASGVLVSGSGNPTRWYPVDHATKKFKTDLYIKEIANRGAHGDLVTDSDGVTWFICDGMPLVEIGGKPVVNAATIYKIPVENPNNWKHLLKHDNWKLDGHISANIIGANRDWICWNSEWAGNDINDSTPWSPWESFKDEIILINIKSGELRRLAHHRSRNSQSNYWWQPVASISPDGSFIIFNSNMGRTTGNYVDAYIVTTGLQPYEPQDKTPSPPKNLKILE